MKIKYIIVGVLLFLLVAVSSASAEELDFSNTPGATDAVSVYATYSGNTLTIWAEPKGASVISARIDEIGFNRPLSKVDVTTGGAYNVLDSLGVYWNFKDSDAQVDGVGKYASVFHSPGSKATRVVVTFIDNEDIPENAAGFEVAAHVAWTTNTGTGEGTADGSAFFAGDSQIPEFPTLAFPVAAILGLLFITQRRKEN
ncbi:PEF-CTERM sorting domain-containing protein [Methanosarcina sp.]|uniref:PEF-CTERM sorting domain-containing protein n=1 Tax=Methanosarcina sp. TaxID=2213 RepID=UPI003C76F8CA